MIALPGSDIELMQSCDMFNSVSAELWFSDALSDRRQENVLREEQTKLENEKRQLQDTNRMKKWTTGLEHGACVPFSSSH